MQGAYYRHVLSSATSVVLGIEFSLIPFRLDLLSDKIARGLCVLCYLRMLLNILDLFIGFFADLIRRSVASLLSLKSQPAFLISLASHHFFWGQCEIFNPYPFGSHKIAMQNLDVSDHQQNFELNPSSVTSPPL